MELYTKSGELSAYGYDCGYITRITKGEFYKEIYKEHNTYFVKSNTLPELPQKGFWQAFETLKEAKTFFKSIKLDL